MFTFFTLPQVFYFPFVSLSVFSASLVMLLNKLTYLLLLLYKPGVYFTNLKCANFTYERLFSSYVLALNELSYEKHEQKTLMKLSPGVYFTNILRAAFSVLTYKPRFFMNSFNGEQTLLVHCSY